MPDVSIGAARLLELMGAVFWIVPADVYIQKTKMATAASEIAPPRLERKAQKVVYGSILRLRQITVGL